MGVMMGLEKEILNVFLMAFLYGLLLFLNWLLVTREL